MYNNKQYWESRLQANYDLQGVGDISLSVNYNSWSYKVTRYVLTKLLRKYTSNKGNPKAMDVGSGTGFIVNVLKNAGKDVTGIDISPTAVKYLSAKYPEFKFIEFDIGAGMLPVEDNSIGCCTAASVLYHIVDDDDLKTALNNIHRVLEKDGIFIFSDNFIHNSSLSITHQKCRTLEEYERILTECRFEVLGRVPNYVLMNDPVDADTKFYPRLWGRFVKYSRASKFVDAIIWIMLYPIELILVTTMKESPAQEFMICRVKK